MAYRYKGANKKGSSQYEAHKKYMREYHVRKRFDAMKVLGNKCIQCGLTDFRILEFDHINGDGGKERKQSIGGWSKEKLYHQIIRNERNDIQLLCANCHRIKTYENEEWKVRVAGTDPTKH